MRQIVSHPVPALLAGRTAPAGLLSNGSYTVLLTAAGTGVSVRRGIALTRGPGDRVEDCEGFFLYLREPESDRTWSAGFAPTRTALGRYEAWRAPGRIVIEREDEGITTRCEVTVDPDADREMRRLTLVNRSDRPRRIEVTSCIEVVLNDPVAHASHPAFSKLFIQTEWDPKTEALLAHRRPRGHGESHPWMVHSVWETEGVSAPELPKVHLDGSTSCETDRARFLGRGRGWNQPLAMSLGQPSAPVDERPLSGTTGSVLDPVFALRRVVTLAPGGSAALIFVLGAADTKEEALQLVADCRPADPESASAGAKAGAGATRAGAAVAGRAWAGTAVGGAAGTLLRSGGDDVFTRAARREAGLCHVPGLVVEDMRRSESLAAAILLGHPGLRAAPGILARAQGRSVDLGQLGVPWKQPYALLHAERPEGSELLPVLLAMRRHWRALDLPIALVVISAAPASAAANTDANANANANANADVNMDVNTDATAAEAAGGIDTSAGGGPDAGLVIIRATDVPAATMDFLDAAARLVVTEQIPGAPMLPWNES